VHRHAEYDDRPVHQAHAAALRRAAPARLQRRQAAVPAAVRCRRGRRQSRQGLGGRTMTATRARIVPIALGAVAVAAIVLLAMAILGGGGDKYKVRAEFKDSAGLRKNS